MITYKTLLSEISMGNPRQHMTTRMGRNINRDDVPTKEEREALIDKLSKKMTDPKEGPAFRAIYQKQIDAHKKALKESLDESYSAKFSGTVDNHPFEATTGNEYSERAVAKQNPHLSTSHVKALIAHARTDNFNDNRLGSSTEHGHTIKVTHNSKSTD